MKIDPFTGKTIKDPIIHTYSNEYQELEDDPAELDPELTKQLLLSIQKQHTNNCLNTTARIKATRTVYSKKLKKNIYATSWNMLGLDTKEGQIPPTPIPTPPPSTPDSKQQHEQHFLETHSFFYDEDHKDDHTSQIYVPSKHQDGSNQTEEMLTDLNIASEISVLDWLKQRRKKELPLLQRLALEKEQRELAKLKIKRKKYPVLLPEDVRGSTANVLHVIRNTIRSFTNQGMKGVTRTLYGKKISNAHDLFQAMDRDGDGDLDYDEVRGAMHRLGIDMTDLEFVSFIHKVDQDKSGSVDVQELEDAIMNDAKKIQVVDDGIVKPEKAVWQKVYTYLKKKQIKPTTLFHDIDDDGSGIINPNELRAGLLKFVNITMTDEEFQCMLKVCDRDGSGEIEYGELSRAIKYGDPNRRPDPAIDDMFDSNEAEEIAKQMYGRYSLIKHAKKKKNQWDLMFDEIERGVVQVKHRKPTPLFNARIEKYRNYVDAMRVPRPPPNKKSNNNKKNGIRNSRGRKFIEQSVEGRKGKEEEVRVPETTATTTTMGSMTTRDSNSTPSNTFSPRRPPSSPLKGGATKQKQKRLLSKEEEINQQKEQWINMSLMDRGGMTRKKYQLQQRLLAINPNPKSKKYVDLKKYGVSSKDGKPKRGDPGGLIATMKAKELAKKMKKLKEKRMKEKGAKAKSRWGKLKFASKWAGLVKNKNDDEDEDDKELIEIDERPLVQGVRLDHPKRVAAFVNGQKAAGKTRKEALEALRKLTPNAHASTKPTAFFTPADALVARAGIMQEIKGVVVIDEYGNEQDDLPDELAQMSMDEEAVVERALVSIARYIHDKRARVVDVFRSMDHDGGGTIDRNELEWGLQKFGCNLTSNELKMVVSVFDSDGGGTIDFKEFAAAIKFAHRLLVKELAKQKMEKIKNKKAKEKIRKQREEDEKMEAKERRRAERRRIRFMNQGGLGGMLKTKVMKGDVVKGLLKV